MTLSREIEKSKQHRVYPPKQSLPAITGSRKKANNIEFTIEVVRFGHRRNVVVQVLR